MLEHGGGSGDGSASFIPAEKEGKPMIEGVVEKEISNAVDAFVENEDALEEYQVIIEKEESSRLYREFL